MSEQPDWKLKKPISAEVLQECFRANLPRFETPDIDRCGEMADFLNEQAELIRQPTEGKLVEKHARLFVKHLPPDGDEFARTANESVRRWLLSNSKMGWEDLACLISVV